MNEEINNLIPNNNSENIKVNDKILNKPAQTRKYWVDLLRVFASYLVILIHYTGLCRARCGITTSSWNIAVLWDALARICVPSFVAISGMFFLNPEKNISISKIYKKYIYRIWKALLFWNIIYTVTDICIFNRSNVKIQWNYDFIMSLLHDIIVDGKYHLWYLNMCIGLYICTPFLRAITENKTATTYYIILVIGVLSPIDFILSLIKDYFPDDKIFDYIIKEFVHNIMFFFSFKYISYYILGYYLSQVTIKSKIKLYAIYFIGVLSSCITYVIKLSLSYKYKKESNSYTENNWSFNIAVMTISTFIFFKHTVNDLLEKLFKRYKSSKTFLKTLSDLSFGCYLIHVLFIEIFKSINFKPYLHHTYITIPLFTTIIWILCNICIYYIRKIKILRDFV